MNVWLLEFAEWIGATSFSVDLHESFYMYNWIETTHVLTLMVSLGMLIVIDLRMLGLCLTNVPASKLAQRLDRPMLIGFSIMVITGVLLYHRHPGAHDAEPVVSDQDDPAGCRLHQRMAVPSPHAAARSPRGTSRRCRPVARASRLRCR